jgi:hypothetical protein
MPTKESGALFKEANIMASMGCSSGSLLAWGFLYPIKLNHHYRTEKYAWKKLTTEENT